MAFAAEALVLHGPTSGPIATRLAMDLRSDGIAARPLALDQLREQDWQARLAGATGLVIVYDSQTWITDVILDALREMHPARPVVVVRRGTRRLAPEFDRFHVVPLFDEDTFSHYQPYDQEVGGYATVIQFLGGGTPARDSQRRGFAFLSYSGKDKQAINERLVPALAANDIGFFDYRFTERLDARKLPLQIERRIKQCALVLVYASSRWPGSEYTLLEKDLAQGLGRPIVAVEPEGDAVQLDVPATVCRFGRAGETDTAALSAAIHEALAGV